MVPTTLRLGTLYAHTLHGPAPQLGDAKDGEVHLVILNRSILRSKSGQKGGLPFPLAQSILFPPVPTSQTDSACRVSEETRRAPKKETKKKKRLPPGHPPFTTLGLSSGPGRA